MKNKYFYLLITCMIMCKQVLHGQDHINVKFGEITPADFNQGVPKFDSGANAVIIADMGKTSFEGNNDGRFTLVFTRFLRVKIINKNGLDIATRKIRLYNDLDKGTEKTSSLMGISYNLENGTVVKTRLDEKSVYAEKVNKNHDDIKFSLPAVKAGTIFDLQYTVKSPFAELLRPWEFQGEYPMLWSEYEVTIPPCFHYVMNMGGNQDFDISTTKEIFETFTIRENIATDHTDEFSLSGKSVQKRWVKKNVPSLHEEPFTTTLKNNYSRISFQLHYFQWDNYNERQDYMVSWATFSKKLLEDEQFGIALDRDNNWMSDELKILLLGTTSEKDTINKIFAYIRDNFKAIDEDGYSKNDWLILHSLKDVYKTGKGNVAEINLLLVAMLRKAGISADPVILSTRDNGYANPNYPLIDEYNYLICVVYLNGKLITLDASDPLNGYGELPYYCYNGWAHIINAEKPLPIEFTADSLNENSMSSVIIINDEKGASVGSYKNIGGKNASYNTRNEIQNTSLKAYEEKLAASYSQNFSIENIGIDSLKQYDFPVEIHFDFELKNISGGDLFYFNPMLNEGYKTNIFKSMERHYPVEMPFQMDETYLLNMQIPAGYQVDELPKSSRVALGENEGSFEYLIQKDEKNIQMRVRIKLNKAFFPVEEYNTLRDFFSLVVKKENEQIVFRKIKN